MDGRWHNIWTITAHDLARRKRNGRLHIDSKSTRSFDTHTCNLPRLLPPFFCRSIRSAVSAHSYFRIRSPPKGDILTVVLRQGDEWFIILLLRRKRRREYNFLLSTLLHMCILCAILQCLKNQTRKWLCDI